MPRKHKTQQQAGPLGRVAAAVKRLIERKASGTAEAAGQSPVSALAAQRARPSEPQAVRSRRREADIPFDVLDKIYTPPMTSSKTSFRSDGNDHQSDQEFAPGITGERWRDEDRFTNRSGDPRIGTHGRTYEPDESRADWRD